MPGDLSHVCTECASDTIDAPDPLGWLGTATTAEDNDDEDEDSEAEDDSLAILGT